MTIRRTLLLALVTFLPLAFTGCQKVDDGRTVSPAEKSAASDAMRGIDQFNQYSPSSEKEISGLIARAHEVVKTRLDAKIASQLDEYFDCEKKGKPAELAEQRRDVGVILAVKPNSTSADVVAGGKVLQDQQNADLAEEESAKPFLARARALKDALYTELD